MVQIREYAKKYKTKIIILLFLSSLLIGALVFVKNDYFLYSKTIVKVLAVSEKEYYEVNEKYPSYLQTVSAKIMNGEHKGKTVSFENVRNDSKLKGLNITKGDDVFVNLRSDGSIRNVDDLKRDFLVALQLALFCFLLFLIASKQSLLIFLSTAINVGIFIAIVILRANYFNVFTLFIIGTVLFTTVTLFIISGINKKTVSAVISTLVSVAIMMSIALITFNLFDNDFYYETIGFLDQTYGYRNIFYSSVLISGLGAIMDTAIIMATSINELIAKNPKIATKELKNSAWEIAQDITGTIMNVLFFSCIVGAIPSIILIVANKMPLFFMLEYYGSAEVIRALVGCIGIVLAVPISYVVNISLRRRWKS